MNMPRDEAPSFVKMRTSTGRHFLSRRTTCCFFAGLNFEGHTWLQLGRYNIQTDSGEAHL